MGKREIKISLSTILLIIAAIIIITVGMLLFYTINRRQAKHISSQEDLTNFDNNSSELATEPLKNDKSNEDDAKLEEDLKDYIKTIYPTGGTIAKTIPEFEDINMVSEDWIWFTIRNYAASINSDFSNGETYITYEEIEQFSQKLFGENFTKKFPKEGAYGLTDGNYGESVGVGQYYMTYIEWPEGSQYSYAIKNIEKNNNNTYNITIIPYEEEKPLLFEGEKGNSKLYNLNGTIVKEYESVCRNGKYYIYDNGTEISESDMRKYVTNNHKYFTTKQLNIRYDKTKQEFYIISCKDI